MPPLHYGPSWVNSSQRQCVEGIGLYWPILVDTGNEIGDGWSSERFFGHIKERNESVHWLDGVFTKPSTLGQLLDNCVEANVNLTRFTGGQHGLHNDVGP